MDCVSRPRVNTYRDYDALRSKHTERRRDTVVFGLLPGELRWRRRRPG